MLNWCKKTQRLVNIIMTVFLYKASVLPSLITKNVYTEDFIFFCLVTNRHGTKTIRCYVVLNLRP